MASILRLSNHVALTAEATIDFVTKGSCLSRSFLQTRHIVTPLQEQRQMSRALSGVTTIGRDPRLSGDGSMSAIKRVKHALSRTKYGSIVRGVRTTAQITKEADVSTPGTHSEAAVGAFVDGMLSGRDQQVKRIGTEGTQNVSDIIFIGTGTSEGIPRVSCLTNQETHCPVCFAATELGNRNRRRNTSIMLRYAHPSSGGLRNILIDAGKFFYHSALQWFPHYGIRNIDAVVITHSHADAIGGLDDLRDWTNNVQSGIPIFVAPRDLEVMEKTHYYLMDRSALTPGTAITPLPVWHGPGYLSLGFRFGDICYISDASEIPAETYPLLQGCDLLILDCLRPDRSSATHFGLPDALAEVRKIRPKRTLLTGMMHIMDHDKVSADLEELRRSDGLDIRLSYDGLRIPVSM
eukprot:jgi/Mesen1/6144/ME000314S05162